MDNYICINGKKAELTEEQMKALGIELPKANPFARVDPQRRYYMIDPYGRISEEYDTKHNLDAVAFNNANYCTDKAILEQRALHETLNRLLWRYSMTHKAKRIDDKVWSIKYDYDNKNFSSGWVHYQVTFLGEIVFDTQEIAENAIEEIIKPFMAAHPDFKF